MSNPGWVQDPDGGWHQAVPPPAPARKPKGQWGCASVGLVAVMVIGLVLFGLAALGAANRPEKTDAGPASPAADYIVVRSDDRAIVVEVTTADPSTLRSVFDAIRANSAQDSAHVTINCNEGATESMDNRLANGTYSRTSDDAFMVGLEGVGERYEALPDKECPPVITPRVADEGAVTADEILAALDAAGIPAPNPRDNTNSNCSTAELDCTHLTTTDILSIHEWPTAEAAARFAEAGSFEPALIVGPTTTVVFASGGSTPVYDRAAIDAVLVGLAND